MKKQPKALVLADALEELDVQFSHTGLCGEAADELRRLHVWEKAYEAVCDERDAISLQRGYGMSRESIEEAIEVLEDASAEMLTETGDKNYYVEAIAILRLALVDADDTSQKRVDEKAKREQEPVAWLKTWSDGSLSVLKTKSSAFADHELEPLYAAPQKREWVGLTDEDMEALFLNEDGVRFARYIEAKLKERNTWRTKNC